MDHLNSPSVSPGKTASDRSFGFVFAAFFCLVGTWPLLHGEVARTWALPVAAVFAVLAVVRPVWLAPLNRQWTRLGTLLHKIVNPIVLGLIFVLTIVPMGLIFRILGKDLLRLRSQPDIGSYWIERSPPGPAADSLPRQF